MNVFVVDSYASTFESFDEFGIFVNKFKKIEPEGSILIVIVYERLEYYLNQLVEPH